MSKQSSRKYNWERGIDALWNYIIATVAALLGGYTVYKLTQTNGAWAFNGILLIIAVLIIVGVGLSLIAKSRVNA